MTFLHLFNSSPSARSSQLSQAQEALIHVGNPSPTAAVASPGTNTVRPTTNGNTIPQSAETSPSSPTKPVPTGPRSQTIKRPPRTHPPPQSPQSPITATTSANVAPAAAPGLSVRGAASTPSMTHELPRRPSPHPRRSRSRSPDRRGDESSRDRYGERDSGRPRDRTPPPGGRRHDNGGDNGGGRPGRRQNNGRRGGPGGPGGGPTGGGPVGPVESSRSLVERMGL